MKKQLENNGVKVLTLGTGNKIINQYPSDGTTIYQGDLVVLLSNDYDKTMIDFTGMSYKDTVNVLKLMNVEYIRNYDNYTI